MKTMGCFLDMGEIYADGHDREHLPIFLPAEDPEVELGRGAVAQSRLQRKAAL
jgi:hypothetical protein